MLAQLNIRNLAVIDEAELDFGAGLTVLTGETGAGKSILVDALALALGERADSRAIRTGSERCEITAVFDLGARSDLRDWLRQHDLDAEDECVLRRVVSADGRSRGYVNGSSAPMQTLREVGERLVDICGQQSHQSLRHAGAQRALLDQFGGHGALVEEMAAAHAAWSATQHELDTLGEDELVARIELLRHEIRELEALNPHRGEFEELERVHRLAANSGRITAGVTQALERTYEGEEASVHAVLTDVRRTLDDVVEMDVELATVTSMLAEAEILIAEAADAMRRRLGQLEYDPDQEARTDRRLSGFHDLARKHRVQPAALPDVLAALSEELADLDSSRERRAALASRLGDCRALALERANKLTDARRRAATELAALITANMQALGMPDGTFAVDVRPAPGDMPGPNGGDRVEFMTAPNPGQAMAPLSRVASGGELSRISLALQVASSAADAVPTLIFDEVDAGVGGSVAEIVGGRLHELSSSRQVLCVTHLPQVASQADHHVRITKISDGRVTRTAIAHLDAAARVDEIARMLGGVRITARTRAHAEEMLVKSAP